MEDSLREGMIPSLSSDDIDLLTDSSLPPGVPHRGLQQVRAGCVHRLA